MLITYSFYFVIFILFSFFVFRIVVRKDYRKKSKLSPLSYLLETILFAVHANMIYLFIPAKWPDLPALPENNKVKITFFVILFIGLLILLIAWFGLGTKRSFGQNKNTLKTSGIYKYSRNPQLLGYGIVLLSFVIAYFSWYALAWFFLFINAAYLMIISEEEFLIQKYGDEYEKYCRSVPRVIKLSQS